MAHYDAPVRNTQQRKYMLALLRSTTEHPNAQWLFERMKPQFPNLSFSTVYRNLGVLEREGQLQRLTGGSAFDRYDANIMPHSHFFCRECNQLLDIDLGPLEHNALRDAQHCPHDVEGCSITFYGVCENCRKANNILNKDKE